MNINLKRIVAACATGVLTAVLLAAPAQADDLPPFGGLVTVFNTHAPVEGACVTAFSATAEEEVATACTDATGSYLFDGLVPGEYKLRVRAAGFADQWAFQKRSWADADLVTRSEVVGAQIDFRLWTGLGTMTGRVIDEAGTPVQFAEINITEVSQAWSAFAVTGSDGRYTAADLPAGQYKVSVWVYNRGFQWAHGKESAEEADVFTVTPDQATVVDEQLLPMGTIEVTVTDEATGEPVESACISVPTDPTQPQTCENVGGVYTLRSIASGTHTVQVSSTTHFGIELPGVVVRRGEVTRVAAVLRREPAILITIVDKRTSVPLGGICVTLVTASMHGLPRQPGSHCSTSNGRIAIPIAAANTYKLFVQDPNGVYGAQWLASRGGTGEQADALSITTQVGQDTVVPTIQMQRPGSITGVVRDPAIGAPVAGVCAHPYALDPRYGYGTGAHCTGSDGRYTITGLGPYKWPVLFTPRNGSYGWIWSGDQPHRLKAVQVQVPAESVGVMDARVYPSGTFTGQVLTTGGQPAVADVWALNATTNDFAGPVATTPDSTTGVYRLTGLYSQYIRIQYALLFASPCWYDGTADFASATVVRATSGRTKTGFNLVDCHG